MLIALRMQQAVLSHLPAGQVSVRCPHSSPPNTAKGCLASAPSPGRGTRSSPALAQQHPQCPLLSSGCRRWRPVGLAVHHSYTFVCPKAVTVRTIKTLLQRVLLPQARLCGRSPRAPSGCPLPPFSPAALGLKAHPSVHQGTRPPAFTQSETLPQRK